MPDLSFVLPHAFYWSGLILFPLFAMWIARRQKRQGASQRTSLAIAYFLLVSGGFVGLHRFYLRSLPGIIFIPLFIAILYGNIQVRGALDQVSASRNAEMVADFDRELAEKALAQERSGAQQRLAEAQIALERTTEQLQEARTGLEYWRGFTLSTAVLIALLLLYDAFRLPSLTRRCQGVERGAETADDRSTGHIPAEPQEVEEPTRGVHSRFTDVIDSANGFVGEFVGYWSVIAVFVYYYEVLARYVFNSPTNWAHESMFLMFGMQYLLAGAFALREGSHVRVDVIYTYFSKSAKALTDVITSMFFFIFAGTLLVTGWIFFNDAFEIGEVSFTEWAIQYWPVKFAIPLGALLILLQGLSRLIKDVLVLVETER